METQAKQLRNLLLRKEISIVPGCYDAIGAKLIENVGFPAAYMSGFCVAASLGKPDVGLVTMTEMVARGKIIAQSVSIPVIADADTGYGGVLNVIETVRSFEQAGVAGIHLEDQVTPKKCAALAGKTLISISEMQQKIKAALAARNSPDFVIIGRTDALAVGGLSEALRRAQAWEEAGADAVMVMSPSTVEEMKAVTAAARKPRIMVPISSSYQKMAKLVIADHLQQLGFSMVIYASTLLLRGTAAQREILKGLKVEGGIHTFLGSLTSFEEMNQLIGLPEITALEERFATVGG